MKQEITEDEYMKKGLTKEIKRVVGDIEYPPWPEDEYIKFEKLIFDQAREIIKKAILKLVI